MRTILLYWFLITAVAANSARAQLFAQEEPSGSARTTQVFLNDYAGFVAAAGPLSTIDFETLPDGTPSIAGMQITDSFNYDLQGAHFTSPLSVPRITGSQTNGFKLSSIEFLPQLTWIDASLT